MKCMFQKRRVGRSYGLKILFDFESKIFEGGGGNESFIVGYDLVN